MGAGASALPNGVAVPQASSSEIAALANSALPASRLTAVTRDIALQLKEALCTPQGWKELQALFKENRADLDEAIPSDEWGRIVYEQEELCTKYFGDATPDEIAAQFLNLDDSAQSAMAFEQFVDGVMSLGLAVSLAHALETPEGAEDLKEVFDTIDDVDEDGRVPVKRWAQTLMAYEDVFARYTGVHRGISPRFEAFYVTGKVAVWVRQAFRRLGLSGDDFVTWAEFRAGGGRATGE